MDSIKADSIVWVKLGTLYGWWPAIFEPANFLPEKKVFPDLEIQESTCKSSKKDLQVPSTSSEVKPVFGYARFFDDDKFDLYCVRDPKDVKLYSCPDKLSTIRSGLKRFEPKPENKKKCGKKGKKGNKKPKVEGQEKETEKKKEGMFDLRARLAQFYKDVELAEVMTDNSPKVAEILQLYEVEGEDWSNEKDNEDNDEEEGMLEEGGGDENPPTENLNPNLGSAESKKRKQTEVQKKTEKAKKKKS